MSLKYFECWHVHQWLMFSKQVGIFQFCYPDILLLRYPLNFLLSCLCISWIHSNAIQNTFIPFVGIYIQYINQIDMNLMHSLLIIHILRRYCLPTRSCGTHWPSGALVFPFSDLFLNISNFFRMFGRRRIQFENHIASNRWVNIITERYW